MPLVNVKVIEGVFGDAQKREIVGKLTDAMVAVEGQTCARSRGWASKRYALASGRSVGPR